MSSFGFNDIPRTGSKVTSGYVMTHEHPTAGMAFGGNYAYAGAPGNYKNGIPDNGYTASCSGCGHLSKCDHGVVKGILIEGYLSQDMGKHSSHLGPQYNSFSHLRYSSDWMKEAHSPTMPYDDSQMKIMLAFAVENEGMCELLYYANKGGGGPGGGGWPCSKGDSIKSLERQIINLKNWAKANNNWVEIAYTAAHARSIVNSSKLAVVLGIEADYAWGAEDRSFDPVDRLDRYYDDGVRTFYMAHKVNSRLAGADIYHDKNSVAGKQIRAMQAISGCLYYDDNIATFPLISTNRNGKQHNFCDNNNCGPNNIKGRALSSKCIDKISEISALKMSKWSGMGNDEFNGFAIYPKPPGFSDTSGGSYTNGGIERNNLSLSRDGSRIAVEAMRRGMIMNLGHVSSKARTDLYNHSQEYYNYPVNALHNNPNEMLIMTSKPKPATPGPNEYDIDKKERNYIKDSGGIFGVRLGPINAKAYDASGVKGENANCSKTSTENAKVLAYLIDEGQRVGYSLDFATITEGTHSRMKEGCLSLGNDFLDGYGETVTHGLAHIGNMKSWHRELEEIGMKKKYVNVLKNKGAEHFLRMWEKSEFISNMPATIMGLL